MAENMKPSGIVWIGDIPESWKTKRVKFLISDIKDGTHGTFDRVDSGELLLSAKNVFDDNIIINENESEISQKDYKQIVSNGFPIQGDVLLCCVGTVGRTCVYQLEKTMAFQRSVAFLRPNKNTNSHFLKYCLQSDSTLTQEKFLINKSAQDGLYMGSIKELIVSYTEDKREQTLIADFLDKQCAKIDDITTDIEKQIELLDKYKKSLITETVTKGLDKNAPMKDSGIEWIGDINTDYKLTKLKYIVSTPITDGPHETPILLDDGVPFLSAEAVRNERLEFDNKRGYISESDHRLFCKKCKPQRNDIFMIKSGATTGKIAIVDTDDEFSIWSPLALVRCDDVMIKQKFIFYSMLSNYFFKNIELAWSYGTQQNIGMGVIGNLRIVLPIVTEQTQIADFLDKKCTQVDAIIETKKQQLELMKKHKQSMIYEYVTGKKRVTEVQN